MTTLPSDASWCFAVFPVLSLLNMHFHRGLAGAPILFSLRGAVMWMCSVVRSVLSLLGRRLLHLCVQPAWGGASEHVCARDLLAGCPADPVTCLLIHTVLGSVYVQVCWDAWVTVSG